VRDQLQDFTVIDTERAGNTKDKKGREQAVVEERRRHFTIVLGKQICSKEKRDVSRYDQT